MNIIEYIWNINECHCIYDLMNIVEYIYDIMNVIVFMI